MALNSRSMSTSHISAGVKDRASLGAWLGIVSISWLTASVAPTEEGGGHYSSHRRTSNRGPQTLTFPRPSKIKSITLWPRTGKHCVGINHLPFHAWLCSLFLHVWLSVWFGGNGWLAVWETDPLVSLLNNWLRFRFSWGRQSSVRAEWLSRMRG